MSKKTLLQYAMPAVIIGMLFATVAVSWEEPGNNPPDGNVPAPINVSANGQYKEGKLNLGSNQVPDTGFAELEVQGGGRLRTVGGAILNTGGVANSTGLIVDNGYVGIGTVSPTERLHIKHNDSNGGIIIDRNSAIARKSSIKFAQQGILRWAIGIDDLEYNSQDFFIWDNDALELRLVINNSGNIGIGDNTPDAKLDVVGDIHYTGTISDVSDVRLKENIIPIDNALNKIMTLEGFKFNMIGEEDVNLGLSAQAVQTVFPEAVDVIETKNDIDYLGLDYTQLIAPMIEAIKEQQEQIEELKLEIEELKK